jgi:hypothetical protein
MRRRLPVLCLLSLIFFMPAQAKPRKAIDSFNKLGPNETVVVGRVKLVPALHEHEQRLRGPISGRYESTMFLIVDAEYRELTEDPGWAISRGGSTRRSARSSWCAAAASRFTSSPA